MAKKLTAYQQHMRRELKGKMKGKTKAQRKALFKAAAKKYKTKSKPKSKSSQSTRGRGRGKSQSQSGRSSRVAKNSFNMSKIYGLMRKGALILPAAGIALGPGTPQQKANLASRAYFAYDLQTRQVKLEWAKEGWVPFLVANVLTRVVPKVGNFIRGLIG
jgi:hypothetical protein